MLNAQIDALIEREKADPNDAKSLYELGVRCWNGNGVEMDPLTAIELYRRAAEMGYIEAQYAYGKMYLVSLQEIMAPREAAKAEGVKWLRKAADQGHEKAQLALAKCYSSGEGVKKDAAKAFKLFMRAADTGYPPAMDNISTCYEQGDGVAASERKAMEWKIRSRAARGDRNAQAWLQQNAQRD